MKKFIYKVLSFVAVAATLTSCLKDDSLVLDPSKTHNVIEFANPGQINSPSGAIYPLYVFSYDLQPQVVLPVEVSYSGAEDGAPQDITVDIDTGNEQMVADYNEEQVDEDDGDVPYNYMPSNYYQLSATQVVIKKGEKRAKINITVNLESFDLSKPFILPLHITSASSGTISGNFNTILLNIGAKNRIDGLYNYKTSSTTSLVPNADDDDVPLVTASGTTVTTNLLNTYSNIITYNIDPNTNAVTVVSVNPGIGAPITDPSSNYNPDTKVLYVKWTAGARRFEETYTYQGPRP